MIVFKTAYRDAGFVPCEDELPDYLPMVLDFAALTPRGERLLHAHRADLELLRRALAKAETPYAHVVGAVCAQLPKLGRRELGQVLTAWESGPPREEVGLEPFAPAGVPDRLRDRHAPARRTNRPADHARFHGATTMNATAAQLFWWVALPYLALGVFVVGHVWRWRYDQFGWTSRSTQLQERRMLKWGAPAVPLRHVRRHRRATSSAS